MTPSTKTPTSKLPSITKSQASILNLLYAYRFLSSNQIQAFLGHANKSKIKIWLKDLTDKGYVERRYSHALGQSNKPAVYSCSLGAIRHFKTTDYACEAAIKRLYKDSKRTGSFITASLMLADIALKLKNATTNTLRFEFATSNIYSHPDSRGNFLSSPHFSPAAVVVKEVGGAYRPYLIEIITYGLPSSRLYGRINAYLDLYFSRDWENHMGLTFPKIFIVCSTMKQIKDAAYFATLQLRDAGQTEDLRLIFMLQSHVKTDLVDNILDHEKTAR
jgi:hypothetical protein